MEQIGYGIFSWDATERQTNRYGAFGLYAEDYESTTSVKVTTEPETIQRYAGKRVRLTCRVVESRKSGHIGDVFLKVRPSQPEVGEVVDLGVGIFTTAKNNVPTFVLKPGDRRGELWIDPRKLYRLHDQTVAVFVEETAEDFTPLTFKPTKDSGAEDLGDGYIQVKQTRVEDVRAEPTITRLGEGLFLFEPFKPMKGRRLPTTRDDE